MQPRTFIGTALAAVAIVLPATQAQAMPAEGSGIGSMQTGSTQGVTVVGQHRYQALANQANERQHYGTQGTQDVQPVTTVSQPSGFVWRDFGVGAAAVTLTLVALLGARRIRESTKHTPAEQLHTS
jgi:hypothetical protein